MDFLLSTIKKDVARWRLDRMAILIWIGIPLMIGGLITTLISGGGAQPNGLLLLVDEDESFVSGLIAGAYSQGQLGELLTVEKVSLEDGSARIDDGDGSALLIIPEGFGGAFFDEEPVTLTLRTNPSQTILPGIIENVTDVLLDAGFYAQRLFGPEIQLIQQTADSTPSDAVVAGISVAINQKIEAVSDHLSPLAFDIEIAEPPAEEPGVPFALLFMPGIIVMAVMFAAQDLSGDYWTEREAGTLRRLVIVPGRLGAFLAGKALAAGMIFVVVGGLTLVIGFLYHGVPWSRLPVSLLWIALAGVGLFTWFSALQMFCGSKRAGNLITTMLVFPLLMAGGSFFPLQALPDWLAEFGRATPNGFVAARLGDQITGGSAMSIDANSWLIAVVMAVSGLSICAWRLRSGFARA